MAISGHEIMQLIQALHRSARAARGGTKPSSFISSDGEGSKTSFGQTKMQIPQSSTPLHVFLKIVISEVIFNPVRQKMESCHRADSVNVELFYNPCDKSLDILRINRSKDG